MMDHDDDWRWTTASGRELRLTEIADDHLQEIERFLLNRGEFPLSRAWQDNPRRRITYNIIRDELERRGLPLLEGDHPAVRRLPNGERRDETLPSRARVRELDRETYGDRPRKPVRRIGRIPS